MWDKCAQLYFRFETSDFIPMCFKKPVVNYQHFNKSLRQNLAEL